MAHTSKIVCRGINGVPEGSQEASSLENALFPRKTGAPSGPHPKSKGIERHAPSWTKSPAGRMGLSNASSTLLPHTSSRLDAIRTLYEPAIQGDVGVKLQRLSH